MKLLVAATVTFALTGLLVTATARASFTVSLCSDNAAAPWSDGIAASSSAAAEPGFAGVDDTCSAGGDYEFLLANASMNNGETDGATLPIPSGEELTNVAANYSSQAASSGTVYLRIDYDGVINQLLSEPTGNASAGTSINAAVPDASSLEASVFCISSSGTCTVAQNVVTFGAMTLTLQDTAPPTLSAQGGGLSTGGTVSGVQTLGFTASSGGSGISQVTVSLGTTVVGTYASTCQAGSLRPCPATATGVLSVNTATVPDGTYPVVLTAYDDSQDPTAINVGTVTTDNFTATQTLLSRKPEPAKQKHKQGKQAKPPKPQVATKLELTWTWSPSSTTLDKLAVTKLAKGTIAFSCHGVRCPFTTVTTRKKRLTAFERKLAGRAFVPGDHLEVRVTAPGHTARVGRLVVQAAGIPTRAH